MRKAPSAIVTRRNLATYRIGRDPKSHIVLVHPSVSRAHAEMTSDGDHFRFKDVGSKFGTFVSRNGEWRQIKNAKVEPDEPVMLGRFQTTPRRMLRMVDELDTVQPTSDAPTRSAETRKLVVILVADMVGYSKMIREDEGGTLSALSACRREVIEPNLLRYHGRVFKVAGDAIFAEFESIVSAVSCALDVQQKVAGRTFGQARRRIDFRIGIHLGEVVVRGTDYLGDVVNLATRLQELSPAGGICISDVIFDQLKGKLVVRCEAMGERRVKHVREPLRVYCIRAGDAVRRSLD